MRSNRPGSIQDAVRSSISAGGGLEAVSSDLDLSVSSLSRASGHDEDRPGGLGVNHLHRLGRIVPAAAEPMAVHFARLAGGVYQPLPNDGVLLSDVNTLMREFSDVLDHHAKAHSDRSENPSDYTPKEAQATIREVDEMVQAALKYRAALVVKAEGCA